MGVAVFEQTPLLTKLYQTRQTTDQIICCVTLSHVFPRDVGPTGDQIKHVIHSTKIAEFSGFVGNIWQNTRNQLNKI